MINTWHICLVLALVNLAGWSAFVLRSHGGRAVLHAVLGFSSSWVLAVALPIFLIVSAGRTAVPLGHALVLSGLVP